MLWLAGFEIEFTDRFYFSFKDKTLSRFKLYRNAVIGVLAFGFSIFLVIGAGQESVIYGALLLVAGVPVYLFVTRGKRGT